MFHFGTSLYLETSVISTRIILHATQLIGGLSQGVISQAGDIIFIVAFSSSHKTHQSQGLYKIVYIVNQQ